MLILNVAEKPSVAKEVTKFLSNEYTTLRSQSKFNPVYSFKMNFRGNDANMKFTSVTGHINNLQFEQQYSNWQNVDPFILLNTAGIL